MGSVDDPHVSEVCGRTRSSVDVLDAESLLEESFRIDLDGLNRGGRPVAGRGWLRRLAPPVWTEAMRRGDIGGAERQACVSTLATVLRDERIEWLSDLDAIAAAENKPWQYRRALSVGCAVPEWLITNDPRDLVAGDWVAKPMGPGQFFDDGGHEKVVPTRRLTPDLLAGVVAAPFLYQRNVSAQTHARVVTVDQEAFSATLAADGLPLDWRMSAPAHHAFSDRPAPPEVEAVAVRVATACRVSYSAQDWIRDGEGRWWFVDLNPAGQWLFLPSTVADRVSLAMASWLDGEPQ